MLVDVPNPSKTTSKLLKGYQKFWSRWRFEKAVKNMGGQARNIIANKAQMWNMMGLDVGKTNYGRALKLRDSRQFADGDPFRPALSVTTIFSDSIIKAEKLGAGIREPILELTSTIGATDAALGVWDKLTAGLQKAWAFNEEIDRVAAWTSYFPKFRKMFAEAGDVVGLENVHGALTKERVQSMAQAAKTMRPEAAARAALSETDLAASTAADFMAKQVVFEYGKSPPAVNFMRGYGIIPFVAFPYHAMPSFFRASLEHPSRMSLWPKMIKGVTDKDHGASKSYSNSPEWMRQNGFIRIPVGDGNGEETWINLTYMVPWGDFAEHGSIFMANRKFGADIPHNLGINVPLFNWVSEITSNRKTLTGAPLWDEYAPLEEKLTIIADRMWMNILPPLLFGSESTADSVRSFNKRLDQHQSNNTRPEWMKRVGLVWRGGEDKLFQAWIESRELYENMPVFGEVAKRHFAPKASTPSLAVAAGRSLGIRLLQFDDEYKLGQVERELNEGERRYNTALSRLESSYASGMPEEQFLEEVMDLDDRYEKWYGDHPFNRWQREGLYSPSYGEQFWIEQDARDAEARSR